MISGYKETWREIMNTKRDKLASIFTVVLTAAVLVLVALGVGWWDWQRRSWLGWRGAARAIARIEVGGDSTATVQAGGVTLALPVRPRYDRMQTLS